MASDIKVLIVEDEEVWSSLYSTAISRAGYQFYVANNVSSALDLVNRHFFHVALLDIVLVEDDPAGEQGIQILEEILQAGERTGAIMITGHPSYARMDQAYRKYGVSRFLVKDEYDESELIKEVSRASESARALVESRRQDNLGPQQLLQRYSVRDLEAQIPNRPAGRLLGLLQSLIRHYVPLLACGKVERFFPADEAPVFETRYWSRLAGREIVVRLGHRKRIHEEANQLKETGQDVFIETRQDIGGMRYTIEDSSPAEFRNCNE